MGKSIQGGKTLQYPTQRKSYFRSRKGIGGRKRKLNNVNKSTLQATYFDKLLQKQSKNEGMLNTPSYLLYEYIR